MVKTPKNPCGTCHKNVQKFGIFCRTYQILHHMNCNDIAARDRDTTFCLGGPEKSVGERSKLKLSRGVRGHSPGKIFSHDSRIGLELGRFLLLITNQIGLEQGRFLFLTAN